MDGQFLRGVGDERTYGLVKTFKGSDEKAIDGITQQEARGDRGGLNSSSPKEDDARRKRYYLLHLARSLEIEPIFEEHDGHWRPSRPNLDPFRSQLAACLDRFIFIIDRGRT